MRPAEFLPPIDRAPFKSGLCGRCPESISRYLSVDMPRVPGVFGLYCLRLIVSSSWLTQIDRVALLYKYVGFFASLFYADLSGPHIAYLFLRHLHCRDLDGFNFVERVHGTYYVALRRA